MRKKPKALPPSDPVFQILFEKGLRKGDLKKIEIIQAAIKCIAEDGIESTTFESIADRLGIGRSHVAYYFPDKSEIIKQAIQVVIRKGQEIIVAKMEAAKTPEDLLEAYIEGHYQWIQSDPNFGKVAILLYHYSSFELSYRDLLQKVHDAGLLRAKRLVEIYIKEKGIRTGRDADEIASNVHRLLTAHQFYFICLYPTMPQSELRIVKLVLHKGIEALIEWKE